MHVQLSSLASQLAVVRNFPATKDMAAKRGARELPLSAYDRFSFDIALVDIQS
jgi:hypothetical protein